MIVIFTEEISAKLTIQSLLNRHFPKLQEGLHWFVMSFNGKSDLEKNVPEKMRRWNYGDPLFVILRDADGGDCLKIKNHLLELAAKAPGKRHKVRIVCQELESWFLGDSQAVKLAYPRCDFSNSAAKYREPDRLTNASQELVKLTGEPGKVTRAQAIAAHLSPAVNCSCSFRVFFGTLEMGLRGLSSSSLA